MISRDGGLTADFAYLCLHGPAQQKNSAHCNRLQLRQWFGLCARWLESGAKCFFIYFDNDQPGYAALNMMELQEMAATLGL
jgi:uncharacterized protein YecE (DUF72 family)